MQKIDHKFVYRSNPGLVPWWMIAGATLSGRILLIGDFSKRDIYTLSEISKSIDLISCQDFISKGNYKPGEAPKKFDVLIINTLNNNTPLDFSRQFASARNLFDHTPAIVLLEPNPFHIRHIMRRPVGILKSLFYDVRTHHIRQYLSRNNLVKYETISHDEAPYESFPASTYFSNKNSFLKKEKIKVFLLNSIYSRIFYNSQIWTLGLEKVFLVQSILESVRKNGDFKWEGNQIKLLRILFNNGKIILSLTSREKNKPEYILVLPFDECALKQRLNEKEAIKKLCSVDEFSNYFVSEIFTGVVDHLTYFAMREFPGITVEIENPNLFLMIDNAFNVIMKLTKIAPNIDRVNQAKRVLGLKSEYFSLILQRVPQHSSTILNLEKSIPRNIELPLLIFMHGDMKLENFVIDPKTNDVIGVIDLELAEFPGIPLIDLYYLISYNYQMVNQETFYQSFVRLITNDLRAKESTYIQNYCSHLNISAYQKGICLAFFYAHHFAKRFTFSIDSESANKEFLAGCESIIEMLEKLLPDG